MKVKASHLIKQKVRYTIHEDELYFDVLEVKKFYPDKKFPADKIKSLPIGGIFTNVIRPQDVEDMTEFDKTMVKFMQAKPNK